MADYVYLEDCDVVRTTEKAALVRHGGEEHWLPFSQMPPGDDERLVPGLTDVTVAITRWLAEQKEIEIDE